MLKTEVNIFRKEILIVKEYNKFVQQPKKNVLSKWNDFRTIY